MANESPSLIAGGNINPSCFVMLSTTADNTALQATANVRNTIGVSQAGTRGTPGLTGASTFAAIAGDAFETFGVGDICPITVGATPVVRGDPLKSDANGNAVTATVAGTDIVCAYALESGAAGALVRCVLASPSKF